VITTTSGSRIRAVILASSAAPSRRPQIKALFVDGCRRNRHRANRVAEKRTALPTSTVATEAWARMVGEAANRARLRRPPCGPNS
jgi:hypothetical protein